jgi:hypothetical protein
LIPRYRRAFNAAFNDDGHRRVLESLAATAGGPIPFPVSETPCFLPSTLLNDLEAAAQAMIAQLLGDSDYLHAADANVPDRFRLPNGEKHPTFVQIDFGLVDVNGRLEGRLIELQAFPSLYGFQPVLGDAYRTVWGLGELSLFPVGLDTDTYHLVVGRAILGGHNPANVVLMEVDPEHQKTRPDFVTTEKRWGVRAIDVRSVVNEGRWLFYMRDGKKTIIHRVYNRLIPDDVERLHLELPFDYRDDLEVEWTGSPDWFFRISKFSLPHLRHPWVPKTTFLSQAGSDFVPGDPRWLLKPLFSYAGGGIVFGPTEADLAAIPAAERHLYVLQERVEFTPVIDTQHGPTQVEIRMMFVRDGDGYRFVLPLLRTGRGKMMGVDHNKGLRWVGASAGLITTALAG